MIRVFIGWDRTESIAWHVLAHSIYKRASVPITICPIKKSNLRGIYTRPRGDLESTEFSMTRFLTPYLSGFEGISVFMDCDMLMLGDIAELVSLRKPQAAVSVVMGDHHPTSLTKMLGQGQTRYPMKNWSSLMIFNNEKCSRLTPEYVNTATGMQLHQFKWLEQESGTSFGTLGSLPSEWNHLVGYNEHRPIEELKLLHWTEGGPWWPKYENTEYSDVWIHEKEEMIHGH